MGKEGSKTDSEPVSDKELEEESDIEETIEKDGLNSVNVTPDDTNYDSETYVGKPAENIQEETDKEPSKDKNGKSYIQQRKSYNMSNVDQNKLIHTHIGDHINYYVNGVQNEGVVAKMDSSFITIFKEDGKIEDIHINDTFFVSDILINKTWNEMSMEERTDQLQKIRAYSPRYLSKTWEDLPRELRDVLKTNTEESVLGTVAGSPNAGIVTNTEIDADDDYEGHTHELKEEQFELEDEKPIIKEDNVADSGMIRTTDGRSVNNPTHNPKKPKTDISYVNRSEEHVFSKKHIYKLKGIPEDTGDTWGIKYINKEDKEE